VPPPVVVPPRVEPAMVTCPQPLGEGVRTKKRYCDVIIGREPAQGILVTIPPHVGVATVLFDLHNRHTYSEEAVKQGKGFHRFTATVGLLTPDVTLLSRAVVLSEFRTAADLVERIGGGSGPGGLKAVAPTGTEAVAIPVAEDVTQVSILAEKLAVVRVDGADDFRVPGRPAALVSDIRVEYQPTPTRPAPRSR
jgi:hypothetical protein